MGQVLRGYLDRLAPLTPDLSARQALVALAFAQAPGFTPDLWAAAIRALYDAEISAAALDRFARAAAANFLIETSTRNSARSVRLFHQALTDALLAERAQWQDRRLDEATLTHAFLGMGRAGGWAASPDYLLRSLPAHAARGGLLDELLAEDGFLLHADLPRLLAHTHHATTPTAHTRARLLRLTPTAATAPPAERAAQLSITASINGHPPHTLGATHPPYQAAWAATTPPTNDATLTGHTSAVRAVCAYTDPNDGHPRLATTGYDHTLRTWNPTTRTLDTTLTGHTGPVYAVCAYTDPNDGHPRLATTGYDGTVRIWDPYRGGALLRIPVHASVHAVAVHGCRLFVGTSIGLLAIDVHR